MLTLDQASLRRRIDERSGGSVAAVCKAWPKGHVPVNRSTLQRWLHGTTLPRSQEDLLSFAAALDLDPMALWVVNPATFAAFCNRAQTAVMTGTWSRLLPALSFLEDFVLPSVHWPSQDMARRFFNRDWTTVIHRHPQSERVDFFQPFFIQSDGQRGVPSDQVWHFAWRPPTPQSAWRPYGFVRQSATEIALCAFSGRVERVVVTEPAGKICVETWVGQGPVDFCIASLHPFSMSVLEESNDSGARVRFA